MPDKETIYNFCRVARTEAELLELVDFAACGVFCLGNGIFARLTTLLNELYIRKLIYKQFICTT